MTIVLDTNVLVSGIINPSGPPGRFVDFLRSGTLTLAVDDRILHEYANVLKRPELSRYMTKSDVEHILDYLRHNSNRILPIGSIPNLPDPKDAPFWETAIQAQVILVTGNTKHYPSENRYKTLVETPAEFINRFDFL